MLLMRYCGQGGNHDFHYIFCDFVVVTSVSSKTDENTSIPELLIPRNVHNQRKYWIALKANLFRDRAYSP